MFNSRLIQELNSQKKAGLYRNPPIIEKRDNQFVIIKGKKYLNFSSNDYLGLGASEGLKATVSKNFKKFGSSSSSSRLVSGNYQIINEAENKYAEYFGYESALFFPSGYQANLGLISSLFQNDDRIFFDKHIHASSVKGLQLCRAQYSGFNHNRISHLEKKLASSDQKSKVVISEALFSMDGDMLDCFGIKNLKEKFQFLCVIDEAHSFGVLGNKGKGIAGGLADIATGTFGKAFGLFGAFLLLPKLYKEYLFNFSSPQIYTTTLPEAHAASAIEILDKIKDSDSEREHLGNMSSLLKFKLRERGFKVSGDAHILSVEIGSEEKAVKFSEKLFDKGILVFPARFPTVPLGKAILRLSLTSLHSRDDIKRLIKEISNDN